MTKPDDCKIEPVGEVECSLTRPGSLIVAKFPAKDAIKIEITVNGPGMDDAALAVLRRLAEQMLEKFHETYPKPSGPRMWIEKT